MKVVKHDQLHACHRFKSQRGMFVMLSWSEGVASWFLKSGQSPASPEKAAGVERECNVSCVDAVRGCTDPVAGICCRSHLQNDHGLEFRAYKSHKGRGDGKGGMDQPVQGPWHGHKGNAWEHPDTSWFIIPRLVRRPVHVPWPRFFCFFFPQHYIALRVAREVR